MAAADPPAMSAVEIQQEFYETVGDFDWELYEKKDRKYLLQKIAIALCGPPTEEGDLAGGDELTVQGYGPRNRDSIMKVYNKIVEKATYSHNGKNIFLSILRVVFVTPTAKIPFYKKTPDDFYVDLHVKKGKDVTIAVFHVFCLRKCIPLKCGKKGCRLYIDHDARVYQTWDGYLTKNKLPEGVLVVPRNGEYRGTVEKTFDQIINRDLVMPQVQYTVAPSPALGLGAKVLRVADTTSTVAGIGALVGVIGVMAIPAAAPLAVGVVTVGAGTSIYGIIRSSIHLADRAKHEEKIGLRDAESRASWINILVSSVGLSFSAAGKLLAWAAATGTNVRILINALQFLKYTTIASGLVGVLNSFGEMVYNFTKYKEVPTKLEIFQFTTSALFLGIGVMSNQTAQDIVQDAQAKTINELRDSLASNTKRNMFEKMSAETRRLRGTIDGNTEVIRSLKVIENKSEFLGKLAKMNKQMNQNKLRISLIADSNSLINNQFKVTVAELHGLGKEGRNQRFASYGPGKVTTGNEPTRVFPSNAATGTVHTERNIGCYIRPEECIQIATFLKKITEIEKEMIYQLLSDLSSAAFDAFLLLCSTVLESLLPRQLQRLELIGENFNYRATLFIYNYERTKTSPVDYMNDSSFEIIVKEFVHYGRIKPDTIKMLTEKLMTWANERISGSVKYFDPKIFDVVHKIPKQSREFVTLRAGEVIAIGEHEILIKGSTIEKLEEWLAECSERYCHMFINFCFQVVSMLSKHEVKLLHFVNADEDLIFRVSHFVIKRKSMTLFLIKLEREGSTLVSEVKNELVRYWDTKQKLKKHKLCALCNGIYYI